MDETEVTIHNMSGDADEILSSLYDFGGMGVLRFGDDFRFLLLREEGGYIVYSRSDHLLGSEHVALVASPKCARFMEKLASGADQLFHVDYLRGMDISWVMRGAERTILAYYPPGGHSCRRVADDRRAMNE